MGIRYKKEDGMDKWGEIEKVLLKLTDQTDSPLSEFDSFNVPKATSPTQGKDI